MVDKWFKLFRQIKKKKAVKKANRNNKLNPAFGSDIVYCIFGSYEHRLHGDETNICGMSLQRWILPKVGDLNSFHFFSVSIGANKKQ